MSPIQSSLPLGFELFINRGLFADHFLKDSERLTAMPEWRDNSGLEETFRQILQLYTTKASRFSSRTNEQQTERDFVRSVLDILWHEQNPGDAYEVQVSIPNVDVRRQPDYAFFRKAADRIAAEPRKGTIEYWRDVPVLGDAKAWTASLDKQRGYDENPSAQICNYLYRSRVRWGILTNGRIWRLYEREKSSAGGVFYEVNLEDLLQSGNLETFKYFYFFFRRAAFLAVDSGVSFVEKVFKGSTEYATGVGERLKESVYDALRLLMNGFFDYSSNGLDRNDSETVKLVHTNALIVLYRLLFLLYAEDRKLLPCDNEHYRDYCLQSIHRQISTNLHNHHSYLRPSNGIWSNLLNLFHLIDEGVREAGIPAYNGGLFSSVKHPNVGYTPQSGHTRWEVGDRWLAEAVDMLAYAREQWDQPGSEDIDYNTLGVQHLGSIYEGLLELKPAVAGEALVEVADGKKSLYKPEREVPNPQPVHRQPPRRIALGEVYLVTNRGERKASGSYYTPKYIVDYIVENTVGPLVDEAAQKVAALRPEVEAEIRSLKRTRREWETQNNPAQVANFDKLIEAQKRRLLEPYLNLKILDPAMGSGHFLVGAADFISLAMATDPIINGNGFALTDIEEDTQAYFKRLVVERCLYGVDLNPLSVELAKLSLWLHTVSKDKALSFLDHHLRCGNSLIGARVEDDLTKPPPMFNARGKRVYPRDPDQLILGFNEALRDRHLKPMLGLLQQISDIPTHDVTTEKAKEELWKQLEAIRPHYRAVAACWLAPFFGQTISADQYQEAVDALHTDADWQRLEKQGWFKAAQAIGREKQFFHWELEFPEIFFDATGLKQKELRGFDAVVGNPPYVSSRNESVYSDSRAYIDASFTVAFYQVDLYYLFIEEAHNLTRTFWSLIVPDPWIASTKAGPFRRWLGSDNQIITLGFGKNIFEADVDCVVIVARNTGCDNPGLTEVDEFVNSESIIHHQSIQLDKDGNPIIAKGQRSLIQILNRIDFQSIKLNSVSTTGRGIGAYHHSKHSQDIIRSRAFHSDYKKDPTYFPELGGDNIRPYEISWDGSVWISYGDWLSEPRDPIFFKGPRILCRKILGERLFCTYITDDWLIDQQVYIACKFVGNYHPAYVGSIVASKLIGAYARKAYQEEGLFPHLRVDQFRNLPIRRISFTTPTPDRARLLEEGKGHFAAYLSSGNPEPLLAFTAAQLAAQPERSDVVHDLLAFLAEQMIGLNKEKQTEIRGFLTWLERTLHPAKIDNLSNKTKVRAYHEYDLNTLLDVLRSNRRRLQVDPDARRFQENVKSEFDQSVDKLTPVKERIAATDALIDQVVYQLYGLTEEEVRVVEGGSSGAGSGMEQTPDGNQEGSE
ncbi:MAG: hypothetical protein C4519_27320 [Desulfobacteraceae bacterium]|nr:MAG: hypothetical protein C4519_27320 [Desulfobacteraceae bacterium]